MITKEKNNNLPFPNGHSPALDKRGISEQIIIESREIILEEIKRQNEKELKE